MSMTVDQFTQQITASGLMTEESLRDWIAAMPIKARPQDGEQLARALVAQKKLTKFQAEQLYAGKVKSLTLGNYVLLDKLGQGGMGMVFKAQHKRMGRLVALKVMSARAMQSSVNVQRFHREVQLVAKLTHPNIVTAHDADEANGTHFLVMELVDGDDLSAYIKRHGPMPPDQAIECILQAARGLGYAHAQGVIHRDIKPHNLLLAKGPGLSGEKQDTSSLSALVAQPSSIVIKILDMGLARLDGSVGDSADQADLTNSGAMMGTVDYMAPEQAMDSKRADVRSDIYSLGCTFYYLLTGQVTFVEDTVMKRLTAHQHSAAPSLVDAVPKAHQSRHGDSTIEARPSLGRLAALNGVFQRMVAKNPAERFQSMGDVITALEHCRVGMPAFDAASSGDDSALQSFLKEMTVGSLSTESRLTVANSENTIVLPLDSAPVGSSDATLVESEFASNQNRSDAVTAERTLVSPSLSTQTSVLMRASRRTWLALAGFAVVLLAGVIIFNITKPDGTEANLSQLSRSSKVEASDVGAAPKTPMGWQGWPVDAPKPAIAPFDVEQAKTHQKEWAEYLKVPVEFENAIDMKFRLIPPGEFTMGSTAAEIDETLKFIDPNDKYWQECVKSEAPQHKVILTQPVYVGVTEVTQSQYEKVMGTNPSHYSASGSGNVAVAGLETNNHPVELVRWNDAAEFCAKLSQHEKLKPFYFRAGEAITPLEGAGYRLLSEAEWEFACRAGTTTKHWIGDQDEQLMRAGWFQGNSGGRTHAVGELKSNPFGLWDTHGNVWEWVEDAWDPTYYGRFTEDAAINPNTTSSSASSRVLRGGGWFYSASLCRSSLRFAPEPAHRQPDSGFRVALVVNAVRQASKVTTGN